MVPCTLSWWPLRDVVIEHWRDLVLVEDALVAQVPVRDDLVRDGLRVELLHLKKHGERHYVERKDTC